MPEARDFFLSHAQPDQPWAEWIAWVLASDGHSTFLSAWDVPAGANLILERQQAARSARRVLLLLSEPALSSASVQQMWALATARDPAGSARTLLPVRVGPCQPDFLLGPTRYLDLCGLSRDQARQALLDAARAAHPDRGAPRAAPIPAPPFPGDLPATLPAPSPAPAADEGAPALRPGTLVGKYRVSRLLGQGGMGAVYEARHVEIDRPVAIKVLLPRLSRDPAQAARFLNEARAAGSVQDPGIVQVHDCGQFPDGSAFLVMEFLHGQTLGERMQAGPMPGGGLRIFHQAAAVLALVHARGIVHRDLKPDNLMLIPDSAMPGGERVKVLDFGIAKLAVERFGSVARRAATGDGAMMGTPLYMAPEQCHDAARATDRADVYSLGVMLYQAQSGAAPISASNLLELISFHVRKERPRPLREVAPAAPPVLAALVGRMLSPEPAERPAMAEVRDTLEALLLPARPIQDQTPPPPDRRKVVLAAGAAAAAGLLLLLGARLLFPDPSAGATGRDLGAPETRAARSAPREKPNTTPAPSPASGPASATGDVPLIVSKPARPAPTPVTEDVPLIIGR